MRDFFLLVWLFPNNKRLKDEFKISFKDRKFSPSSFIKDLFFRSKDEISNLIKILKKNSITYITVVDELYPREILTYNYQPYIFSCKGDFSIYSQLEPVCFVGSRRLDPELEEWIFENISIQFTKILFVSGGAIGTDQAIHRSAIRSNNKTLFVLPSGLLNAYPKGVLARFENSKNTVFVSQFSPFQKMYKSNFYARNYFMSALSNRVVILQAEVKSGTLVTSKYAVEMNKELFVLSCSPWDKRYSGNKKLLNEGAGHIINLDLFQ